MDHHWNNTHPESWKYLKIEHFIFVCYPGNSRNRVFSYFLVYQFRGGSPGGSPGGRSDAGVAGVAGSRWVPGTEGRGRNGGAEK